jgi:ABC-type amino acid transport substrate-binding protein
MHNYKLSFARCASMIAALTALLAGCSTVSAPADPMKVCRLVKPDAVLMQSRQNGALTIGLSRLEAALADTINAGQMTKDELISISIAASRRLAELGDDSNATAIALQGWIDDALKRCQ